MTTDDIVTDPNLAAVLRVSQQARQQALELVDLIAKSESPSQEAISQLAKQQKLLTGSLSQLRGLHRAACFTARETKARTADARQEVDRLHLQLQNLNYEQRHLQGEIDACDSYDHPYLELPLIPEEEYLAQHPEHANIDPNELMTERIQHEKRQREALEKQREALLKNKTKLIADNRKRKDDLANLDKDLEKFIDAAKPIQELFDKIV
ncbi:uncharacterized protein E0L32_001053 [Thyridium curvatum]|uniref:THO complex subunit 5 n=1 Tax=Thyridium curvatum TaxID=1093900 RepID=A0A507AKZ2_9PEZI|nr:uncharacterized protein E0L32_001053 [Thyridium curvatum]TPX11235.1 hypothetical protein E0L32_001053 [Thyridium curvatum]